MPITNGDTTVATTIVPDFTGNGGATLAVGPVSCYFNGRVYWLWQDSSGDMKAGSCATDGSDLHTMSLGIPTTWHGARKTPYDIRLTDDGNQVIFGWHSVEGSAFLDGATPAQANSDYACCPPGDPVNGGCIVGDYAATWYVLTVGTFDTAGHSATLGTDLTMATKPWGIFDAWSALGADPANPDTVHFVITYTYERRQYAQPCFPCVLHLPGGDEIIENCNCVETGAWRGTARHIYTYTPSTDAWGALTESHGEGVVMVNTPTFVGGCPTPTLVSSFDTTDHVAASGVTNYLEMGADFVVDGGHQMIVGPQKAALWYGANATGHASVWGTDVSDTVIESNVLDTGSVHSIARATIIDPLFMGVITPPAVSDYTLVRAYALSTPPTALRIGAIQTDPETSESIRYLTSVWNTDPATGYNFTVTYLLRVDPWDVSTLAAGLGAPNAAHYGSRLAGAGTAGAGSSSRVGGFGQMICGPQKDGASGNVYVLWPYGEDFFDAECSGFWTLGGAIPSSVPGGTNPEDRSSDWPNIAQYAAYGPEIVKWQVVRDVGPCLGVAGVNFWAVVGGARYAV